MKFEQADLLPFYEFAVSQVEVGVHAVDVDGKTILYNPKMKEIEGLELADLQDRSFLDLFRFEKENSTLLSVLQSGEPILNVKQTYWNKNGHEITTINDTYPIYSNEALAGAIELSRDVTNHERMVFQPFKKQEEDPVTFSSLIASSASMRKVIFTAEKAAIAKLPVLLIGEPGTGKGLIAKAIHQASHTGGSFHTLFCSGADENTFLHLQAWLQREKSGTVFCRRIDLLSYEQQRTLLTVLNELENAEKMFIASVGEDPIELIASSRLIKELYYAFSSMAIKVEPLRDRKEDILPLTHDFFTKYRLKFSSAPENLDEEALKLFHSYDWPGNVRELELLLDEIVSVSPSGKTVSVDMLPQHFLMKSQKKGGRKPEDFLVFPEKELLPLDAYLQEAEIYYLQKVLGLYGGNVTKAAQALGMSRQNLQYRLRKMKKNEGQT